MIVIYYSLV